MRIGHTNNDGLTIAVIGKGGAVGGAVDRKRAVAIEL